MKKTGAQIIIETMIEHGVDTVFGYPGGSVLNIYDELYKNSDRIKHVITCHEQGAAHAADGYARATGKTGVVFATSGPGATNLVTGIATAYLDSTPMVAITGNVSCSLIGRDSFQEVDILGITMPVTKHNYMVKDITKLAPTIREAFKIAREGRPGPVLIDIPNDIQIAQCEYEPARPLKLVHNPEIRENDITEAVKLIKKSSKPFIYAGGGVINSDAGAELVKLAGLIDAPVGASIMGLSGFPNDDGRFLGMTGMHGGLAANRAFYETDLLIVVGSRFSDRATGDKTRFAPNAKILHIDIDPAEIDKNIHVYKSIVGDINDVLKSICAGLSQKKNPEWWERIAEMRKEEKDAGSKEIGRLTPRGLIEKVREFTDDETIIATDVGQHQMWTAQYYKFKKPRTFITSGGLGTMGFGMGAAIGSCIASGGRRTVLFTGDGSFRMNLNELATAVAQNLPIVIIIMDNGVLGMVRQWQTMFYGKRYSSTTIKRGTDFVALARAFGAEGLTLDDISGAEDVLKKAFACEGTVVIDCMIDRDEMVFPMIPSGGSIENIIY